MSGPGFDEGDGSGPGGVDPAARALVAALRYRDAERFDLAERALREALATRPDEPRLLELLAATLVSLERADEAEQVARDALAIEPESAVARSALAAALVQQGRHAEAELELLAALRSDPDDVELLVQYAALLLRVGQLDKASKVARRALQVDPENADAHHLLAVALAERRDKAAPAHGGRALELAPADAQSHVAVGLALFRGGRPFRARHHLREALRLEPSSEAASAFADVDAFCRPPGLPLYWFARLVDRLPGKQFGLWGLFVLFVTLAAPLGLPATVRATVAIAYLALVVYTWVAWPLTKAWVRVFPSR